MSAGPITFQTLPRYKTILGLGPIPGNVGQILNIFAVDDDSFGVFTWDSSAKGFICWVIDVPSLAITYYKSITDSGNLQTAPILFGPGNFMLPWNDGTTYFFSVRNLKLNNPSPILLMPSASIVPGSMCGAIYSKVFYDGINKRLAFGYYNPINGSMYTSAYQVAGGGLTRAASGFPCYWSIADTWDRTQSAGNGANSQIYTNNISVAYTGNPTIVYRQRFYINLGIDQNGCLFSHKVFASVAECVANGYSVVSIDPNTGAVDGEITASNLSGQYVAAISSTILNTERALGVQGFCDSNIPGLVGLSDGNGVHLFGDGGAWLYLPVQFGGIVTAAITKNYVAGVISFEGMSIGIYQTPSSGVFNGSNLSRYTHGLLNYARPVSVIGKYRA